jgi:hypothetical protein
MGTPPTGRYPIGMTQQYGISVKKPLDGGVGVWIDSRKAVVIDARPSGDARGGGVRKIAAELQDQSHLRGGVRAKACPYGLQTAPADDMRETSSKENLQFFFNDVVAALRGARNILIFGPGEAKEEFRKRLRREGLGGRIVGLEPAGRMSDRQIAAKVRAHFRPRD